MNVSDRLGKLRRYSYSFAVIGIMPAVLVIFLLSVHFLERDARRGLAIREMTALTELVVRVHDRTLRETEDLLAAMALSRDLRSSDPAECSRFLSAVGPRTHGYDIFLKLTPEGILRCGSIPHQGGVDFSNRDYFRRAMDTLAFTAGDYIVGKVSGKPVLPLAYPALDETGAVRFLLVCGLEAAWLSRLLALEAFPEGAEVALMDGRGVVYAGYPESAAAPGERHPHWEALAPLALAVDRGGRAEARIADGWSYCVSPLSRSASKIRVAVRAPLSAMGRGGGPLYFRPLVLGLILALGIAFWIWMKLLYIPQRALVTAIRRMRKGDLSARTGVGGTQGDIGELARMFDEMAEGLAARDRELQARTEALEAANAALTRSQERYRELVENMPSGVAVYEVVDEGRDFIFREFNRTAERMEGQSRQEVIGRSLPAARTGIEAFGLVEVFRRVWQRGVPEHHPVTLYEDDRLAHWYENDVYRLSTGEIVAIFNDVTDRKRAELEAASLHNTIEAILLTAPLPIVMVDLDGKVRHFWNAAAERLLGWKREEVVGRLFPPLADASAMAEFLEVKKEILDGRTVAGMEVRRRAKDGGWIDFAIYAAPFRETGEEITGYVAMLLDIRDRKRAVRERKAIEEKFQQAQKMEAMGTLAGGIAHDFNNILFPIIGYTEMLHDRLAEDERGRSFAREILKAAGRARELVRQILDFSRATAEERKPFRMQLIVKEALKLLRASIPADIEFQQRIDEECPSVVADPTQLHQVMMNLCTNAYHAMMKTGGVLTVSLSSVDLDEGFVAAYPDLAPGSYVRLSISDTGVGIPPEIRDRIFEPFFTTKESGVGTGMGLSMVRGIVTNHGGLVTVRSEPRRGTTFDVHLPVVEAAPVEIREPDEGEGLPSGDETVLIIDDEQPIARMLDLMVRGLGYHAIVRTDSLEALRLFREDPWAIDLVITDMSMPNMTGLELMRELMAIRSDIPVILCTGFSRLIDEEKARAAGARAFVMKPFVKGQIARAIRRALDGEHGGPPDPSPREEIP